MAWHIIRIEPADNDTLPERSKLPVIKQIAVRGQIRDMPHDAVRAVLEQHGYELGSLLAHSPITEWPLTAYIYTSMRRDGLGRSGSTLRRWPVRLLKD
jgi:hypothetical protein